MNAPRESKKPGVKPGPTITISGPRTAMSQPSISYWMKTFTESSTSPGSTGVVETDSVGLEFKDEMSQAVMKPIGAEGYEYTYVIMPMRV